MEVDGILGFKNLEVRDYRVVDIRDASSISVIHVTVATRVARDLFAPERDAAITITLHTT